ncbi:hypothetical protein DFH94DRAFT_764951, partial [Russula ochroleuca]
MQEARLFNESPISRRKSRALLTRIVYLLYIGENFGTQEATTLFFGTTKLFQHKDSALRRMIYMSVKELAVFAEDVIVVIYRPNAIRALCRFIDALQGVERFLNAAVTHEAVDAKSSASFFGSGSAGSYLGFESSTSTNSGYQPMPSTIYIAQYHVPGLLYLIRRQNRMAVTKMIRQIDGGKPGSGAAMENPMALSMLIRYVAKVVEEDQNVQKQSDMVNFEAACVICEMKGHHERL